jgi:DNA-binding ferritin-like protein
VPESESDADVDSDDDANNVVLLSLMKAYKIAEDAGEIGVSNFLQDRVIAHQKHGWMLKSTLK